MQNLNQQLEQLYIYTTYWYVAVPLVLTAGLIVLSAVAFLKNK